MNKRITINPVVLFIFLFSLFLTACAGQKEFAHLPMVYNHTNKSTVLDSNNEVELQFQFHGTASGLITLGDESLLMDPFVSNPSLFSAIFKKLSPDTIRIEKTYSGLSNVKGIIVGHGHYDHLMDVPEVIKLFTPPVPVYGNQTVMNQISSVKINCPDDRECKVAVNDVLDCPYDKKNWYDVPDSHIKIYPVQSKHAPQLGSMLLAEGGTDELELPTRALQWKEGVNVNYSVRMHHPSLERPYLIYVQTSSSQSALDGLPPQEMLADIGNFDLVILSAASHENADSHEKEVNYPGELLKRTKPKSVIIIHWDNFFEPPSNVTPNPMSFLNIDKLIEKIMAVDKTINVSIPMPGSTVYIPTGLN